MGYHYVDGREPWQIDQRAGRDATEKAKRSGKSLWASEEWSMSGGTWDGTGAMFLARLINKLKAELSSARRHAVKAKGSTPAR